MFSVRGARPTATRTFSASFTTCLPSEAVKVTFAPFFVFSTFSTFAPTLMSMPRFLKDARQLLAYFFVFVGNDARQELDDGDLGIEAAEDGAKLDAHRACADDGQRFRNLLHREDLNIGQDRLVGGEAGQHLGVGASGEDHVLRCEAHRALIGLDGNRVHAVLRRHR